MGRNHIYSIDISASKQQYKTKSNTKNKVLGELSNHYVAIY